MAQTTQSPAPVDFDADLYVNGLKMSWGGSNLITVGSGACRNSDNDYDLVVDSTLSMPGQFSLDVGTFTVNTFYAMYVIGDKTGVNSPSIICSKSFTQPFLPLGYNAWRFIGSFVSNSGNAFENFAQYGNSHERVIRYHDEFSNLYILVAGNAARPTTVSCAKWVSPNSQLAMIQVLYASPTVGNILRLGPGGSTITNPFIVTCFYSNGYFETFTDFEVPAQNIVYSVTGSVGDSAYISIMGYKEYI